MRPSARMGPGLALLAGLFLATRADAVEGPQEPDPVLVAEYISRSFCTGHEARVNLRADGLLSVRLSSPREKNGSPDVVEEFRLTADERRTLTDLVRSADFLDSPEVPRKGAGFGERRLRLSLDGRERDRGIDIDPSLAPLGQWFSAWTATAGLLADLKREDRIGSVFSALGYRDNVLARRDALREPLREFAAKAADPVSLMYALGALAEFDGPGPWSALASRRAAALGEDSRSRVLEGFLIPGHWFRQRVSEAHRAALQPAAYDLVRERQLARAGISRQRRQSADRLLDCLARHRFEPLFTAIPEFARASLDDKSAPALRALAFWGERGFTSLLGLTADPDPGMRRVAARSMRAFLYEHADRPGAEHPVTVEERASLRVRLLDEGLARLDAMGQDAAEGRDGRYHFRREAEQLRWLLRPEGSGPPTPTGITVEVRGQDRKSRPGVRVRAFPMVAGGQRDGAGGDVVLRETDASGMAKFEDLASGDWEFDVDHPLLRRCWTTAARSYRQGASHYVPLIVRDTRAFSGRLVGNSGRALAGAAVCRIGADGSPLAGEVEHLADPEGRVTIPDVPHGTEGRARVRLPDGRTFLLEERHLSGSADWVVDLGPDGGGDEAPVVTGRVVGLDGKGLQAQVVALAAGTDGPPVRSLRSRADGSFELFALPSGAYRLVATYRGVDGFMLGRVPAGSTELEAVPAKGVVVTIPLGARLSGRVVDESGSPIAPSWIVAELRQSPGPTAPGADRGRAPPPPGARTRQALTDAEGRFLIEDLQEGEYLLSTSMGAAWWIDRSASVSAGATELVVRAVRTAPISGSVVSKDGVALAGLEVLAVRLPDRDHKVRVKAWPTGGFDLQGTDPTSDYELSVVFEDGVVAGGPTVVRAGTRSARLEVDPGPLGTVVLRDRFGEAASNFHLRFVHEATGRVADALCDEKGVAILPIRSTGRWRVERGRPVEGRATVLGIVESGVAGQVIALPEEWP